MTDEQVFAQAVERLQEISLKHKSGSYEDAGNEPSITAKDEVYKRYQFLFGSDHLPDLTASEFRSFLLFDNNQHWNGIHRQGSIMTRDMPQLRDALAVLQDEDRDIAERYDYAISSVKGLGRAVTTPILHVLYPDSYGVWNAIAEQGMKMLNLWPRFSRGEPEGSRYAKINDLLKKLSESLDTDLWTLDVLWHCLLVEEEGVQSDEAPDSISDASNESPMEGRQRFGMERQLHDFLRDNWERTPLGKEWAFYSEPGNPEAGYEYPCGVGRIDLLARRHTNDDWLVVELKRAQSSDDTVGQVLRYMGWVQEHLAAENELVKGLIISHDWDKKLFYATKFLPDVDVMLYEVQFTLHPARQPEEIES